MGSRILKFIYIFKTSKPKILALIYLTQFAQKSVISHPYHAHSS